MPAAPAPPQQLAHLHPHLHLYIGPTSPLPLAPPPPPPPQHAPAPPLPIGRRPVVEDRFARHDLGPITVVGQSSVFHSVNTAEGDVETESYPVEYLNSLNFGGIPPSRLEVKPGVPLMLLRNIDPQRGLCNGT